MYLILERKASSYLLLELLNVKLAYMPSCIRPEVRLPFGQNLFCVVIVVKKMHFASPSSLVIPETVPYRKINCYCKNLIQVIRS